MLFTVILASGHQGVGRGLGYTSGTLGIEPSTIKLGVDPRNLVLEKAGCDGLPALVLRWW